LYRVLPFFLSLSVVWLFLGYHNWSTVQKPSIPTAVSWHGASSIHIAIIVVNRIKLSIHKIIYFTYYILLIFKECILLCISIIYEFYEMKWNGKCELIGILLCLTWNASELIGILLCFTGRLNSHIEGISLFKHSLFQENKRCLLIIKNIILSLRSDQLTPNNEQNIWKSCAEEIESSRITSLDFDRNTVP
jgi:hypothetical protein